MVSSPLVLGLDKDLLVELGGVVPAEVLRHAAHLEPPPALLVLAVRLEAVAERLDELVRLGAVERPPEAGVLERVERRHGVPQPADGVHDGDGAVRHGVELVEAARLEPRRHDQHVGARRDPVRHLHREPHPPAHLAVVLRLEPLQHHLQVAAAGAQQHQLHVLPGDPRHRVADDVHTFLPVEPPDEPDQRHVVAHLQPQLALQRRLAPRLAGVQRGHGVVGVAVGLQVHVHLRVPLPVVDAVHDAVHLPVVLPYDVVEAPAALRRLQLPEVAGAHGHHPVRHLQARAEDVGVLAADGVVQLEVIQVVLRQFHVGEFIYWATALQTLHEPFSTQKKYSPARFIL
ncbi:Os06g0229900 [Oryza sativa Japonica Group]|uniref:Os06g0229900 protein n=2 Tax=Oryza sativa subsp. japonica TaxID=39947 RepID=Q0DDE2_ORYSJ|nr:hypothetical protein EE612_032872 [Oryza sativa]BAD37273.1 unknown protein [Oryza sativa Japonica Group]BAF19131.1 Os06g0229900 [Oryza sativa Japonica Group]BAS96902.1 Os06g0229900 [Oryza sativa Japonica Group]|eukprot:NP_001057217.1 Os06g0229900 [Oryza sativa Japonica Group]